MSSSVKKKKTAQTKPTSSYRRLRSKSKTRLNLSMRLGPESRGLIHVALRNERKTNKAATMTDLLERSFWQTHGHMLPRNKVPKKFLGEVLGFSRAAA